MVVEHDQIYSLALSQGMRSCSVLTLLIAVAGLWPPLIIASDTTPSPSGPGDVPAPAPAPAAVPTEQSACQACAASSGDWRKDGPCWYASPASRGVLVQHRFCDARSSGSGTVYACCPVERDGLAYDCGKEFGRCACVGVGCPKAYGSDRGGGGGSGLLGVLLPVLFIVSIISCCVSWQRRQAALYYQQELTPMPGQVGAHPNAPGYGHASHYGGPGMGAPVYQQNQGMSAGTAGALGLGGGLLGGMLLAGAFNDGGGHDAGGSGQHQDMGGGGDIGADMGFGE